MPVPTPPVYDEPEYDEEDEDEDYFYDYGAESEPSLLGNPYMIAALVVGAAILMAIFVVVLFGQGGNEAPGATTGSVTATATAQSGATGGAPGSQAGLTVRSLANATVREGPALSYLELGLLRARQDVQVIGRNDDASWFQITFPPNTNLAGWVPSSALDVPDNVSAIVALADVTPVPRPEVEPTSVPAAPTTSATATPAPGEGADVALAFAGNCRANGEVVLVLTNVGDIDLVDEPVHIFVSNDGRVLFNQTLEADIVAGASAQLSTGVPASPPSMTAAVTLEGLQDVNAGNNIANCNVRGGGNDDDDDDDNGNGGNNGPGGNVPPPIQTPGND